MPDSSTKKLLVKLGISATEWNKVVSQIKSQLADMNKQAVKDSEKVQALAKKESELQKQKLKDAREELDVYDRKIKQIQKTLDVQELDSQQKKTALEKAKSLLQIEQAQLNLLSKQKEFRDVDLSKLRERIDLRKSELSVLEAQFRLEQPNVKLPAAGEMGAGRMAQLQAGLQRAQATTAVTQVKTEMATQAAAYQQGLIETKKYVEDSIVLLTKKHQVMMELIQQEKLAQEAAIAVQVKTGKLPAEEAKIQSQIIAEAVKKREILEQEAYEKEVARLNALVKKEEQSKIVRMTGLKTQVSSVANREQQAQIQAQIRATETAYRTGEIRLKEYVATETALQNKLHALRLRGIEDQKQAMLAAIQAEAAMGKKSAEEVALMIQKVEMEINRLRIQAEQARTEAVSGLPKTGLIPTLTRGFEGQERGVGGILGGLTGMAMYGGMGGGVLGAAGGILGSMAGPEGALLGGLLGGQLSSTLDSIVEKIKRLGDAIEEATGKEAQLAIEFEKLARGQDTDPDKFIKRLRDASHGLADNAQLYQMANNFMRLGMHLTSDQIVELTRVTVDLSRASGKTAEEGMNALVRASRTGRLMMLAFTTGIPVTEMRLRGLSSALSPLARQNLELAHYLEIAKKQLEALGTPMLTLPEVIKIYKTAQQELTHEFAQSIASTKGFGMAMGELAKIIRDTEEYLMPFITALGEKLGQALYLIGPAVRLVAVGFHQFYAELKLFATLITLLIPGLRSVGGEFKNFAEFVGLMATVFDEWTFKTEVQISKLDELAEKLQALSKLDFSKLADISKAYDEKRLGMFFDYQKRIKQDLSLAKTGEEKATITPDDKNIALAKMMAKLRLQIATEEAKQRFEIMQQELDEEKQAIKEHYEQGLISLQESVNQQKAVIEEQKAAKIKELEEMRDLRMREMEQEAEESKEPPELTRMKEAALKEKTDTQILQIVRQTNRQELALDNQLMMDKLAARRAYTAAVLEIQKQGAEQQKKELEDQLQGGEISPADYISQRKMIIAQELALTEQGLQAEYDASEKNEKSKEELNKKTVLAEMDAQKQLADLEMKQNDIFLKAIEGKYGAVEKYLEATLKLGQLQAAQGGGGNQLSILENMQEVVKQHIDALTADMQRMQEEGTSPISDDYIKIVTAITQAKEKQIELNQEVAKMKDYMAPVADLMSQIESTFSSFPGVTPFNLGPAIKSIEAISKYKDQHGGKTPIQGMIGGFRSMFGGHTAATKVTLSPIDQFKASVSSTTPTVNSFSNALGTAIASLQKFSATLTAPASVTTPRVFGPPDITRMGGPTISTVSNLPLGLPPNLGITPADVLPPSGTEIRPGVFSTTAYAHTPVGAQPDISGLHLETTNKNLDDLNAGLMKAVGTGAAGRGATGLAAFTGALGSAVQGIGGMVGTIAGSKNTFGGIVGGLTSGAQVGGMFGGPIGAAIGATVGAVAGGIVGSKQHAVNEQVKQLDRAFQNVVNSLNSGATKIGDAINQLAGLRQQAISELGGSKKGQKQLPGVLQQLDQELIALQNQQHKILHDMFDQIKTLAQPTAMQPIVQQLSDIVKTYQQYLSAASGNPQFVARAHQYMQMALQNYIKTMSTDLRSAQEDAINNALQLLDLERQKAQIISQEAQQEYDIMTQGVLTRQRTIAQTKIGQIEQLRYERDLQLEQINQQIALAQYRMQAEQKIFGFTVDRISLEAQLLALKEQDANLQLLQIKALQDTIGKLQAAMAAGLPWGALAGTQTTGVQGALDILQGMITPTSTHTNVTPNLETQMAQLYALRGRYGAGGFSGRTV